MSFRSPLLIAAAIIALPGAAIAQGTAPARPAPAAPAAPAASAPKEVTQAQIEDAAFDMRVLVSAMQSDKVEGPAKDALFQCIYQNSFGNISTAISDAIGKVTLENGAKIDRRNPDQVLGVMVRVCGFQPQAAAPAKPATPAAPARPAPTGR